MVLPHLVLAALSMRRILRLLLGEPVVQFLLLGALLYGAATLHARRTDPQRIVLANATVALLEQRFQRQFGRSPSSEELEWLIERHVRDEIFYREGMALGLGEGDEVVRRRVVQKMEFLSEGEDRIVEPTAADLHAFYRANAARYASPARVTFEHRYFSPDNGGEGAAAARAERALAAWRAQPSGTAASPGDAGGADRFWERLQLERVDREEIERIFGRSDLAAAVFDLPVGQWAGPLRSGLGWHLVRIEARAAPRTAPFKEVEADVRVDWLDAQRARYRAETFAALKRRYLIVREAPPLVANSGR